jgi:curved DNA-binding protein CbpA
MTLDPYKTLKISRDAPDEVVRAAYKVLASKYHPDKNPGDDASARMMQHINDAYALLSNPIRRSEYDHKSTGGTEPPASEQPHGDNKRVIICCLSCKCALRVAETVLSAPERFKIICPECKKDPFTEPKQPQPPPEDSRKSVINCKNCGQSIIVLSTAIQNPDRFDVICPKCKFNPLSEIANFKYAQSPKSYNKSKKIQYTELIKRYKSPFIDFFRICLISTVVITGFLASLASMFIFENYWALWTGLLIAGILVFGINMIFDSIKYIKPKSVGNESKDKFFIENWIGTRQAWREWWSKLN